MKYCLLFLCLFSRHSALFSQQVAWATNISFPAHNQPSSVATDDAGNIYYSATYVSSGVNTCFISKYSPGGETIFQSQLGADVYLENITQGPDGRMLVCGIFKGSTSIGSFQVSSTGSSGGFIGALNEQGGLAWLSLIDGPGADAVKSVAFSHCSGRLLATGAVRSAFAFNGVTHHTVDEPHSFVADLTPAGQLSQYKLFDYRKNDTTWNSGMTIRCDSAGNFFLMDDREGKFWHEDDFIGPDEGIYLSRLNDELEPVWSKFIISSACYYGFKCAQMAVTSNGIGFVPSFCSGKYGGTGLLRGFSPEGSLWYTLKNNDGHYNDVCSSGGDIYAVGTESANGCPCEANFAGFRVLRKIASEGESVLLTFESDVNLYDVDASPQGLIVVKGTFSRQQLQLGPVTLINENGGAQPFICVLNTVSGTVSVEERHAGIFELYPNPSGGEIFLELPEGECEVTLTSLSGSVFRRTVVQAVRPDGPVRISALPKGVFVVSVTQRERSQVKKVVVQ